MAETSVKEINNDLKKLFHTINPILNIYYL